MYIDGENIAAGIVTVCLIVIAVTSVFNVTHQKPTTSECFITKSEVSQAMNVSYLLGSYYPDDSREEIVGSLVLNTIKKRNKQHD